MRSTSPFARATALAGLVAAAFALPGLAERQTALASLGTYTSHGKRKTAAHPAKCYRRDKRAAVKRRNVARNRAAHRG